MKFRTTNFKWRMTGRGDRRAKVKFEIRNSKFTDAFTLIEIMVVVGIIGLVMAMGVPTIYRLFHKEGFRKTMNDVVEVCTAARAQAILQGDKTRVMFYPHEGRVELVGGSTTNAPTGGLARSAQLEGGAAIEILGINGGDYSDFDAAWVRFFPNGTCDDLRFVLRAPNGDELGIELEVTTAQARIVPLERIREWLVR